MVSNFDAFLFDDGLVQRIEVFDAFEASSAIALFRLQEHFCTGFFGIFVYLRYPTLMTRNRASTSRGAMLEEIAELDDECLKLALLDQNGNEVSGVRLAV